MYDEDLIGAQQMQDAALVRSARLQIQAAVLELSVRPLEDEAAVQLRAALGPRVVVLGDGVPTQPSFGTLVNEYNKLLLRRVALWVGQ